MAGLAFMAVRRSCCTSVAYADAAADNFPLFSAAVISRTVAYCLTQSLRVEAMDFW
jgi:hypothetical protein